ncbi:MAG: hypothetical protein AAF628_21915 [Planctomycetota bacterium]
MTTISKPLFLATGLLVATCAPAQIGLVNGITVDVEQELSTGLAASHGDSFGVVHAIAAEKYFVSTARAVPTGDHLLVQLSEDGEFEAAFPVPAVTSASRNGLYDLTYDEEANVIYGGTDYAAARELFAFDVATLQFDASKSIPIPAGVPGLAARALTYLEDGNGGQGSFWIGDGYEDAAEISVTGTLLRTVPAIHPDAQAACYDHDEGLVWWFGPGGTPQPNQGVVGSAMDSTTGLATGAQVLGDDSIPGTPAGGVVRGAHFFEEEDLDHDDFFLLVLTDADSDHFYEMAGRFHVEEGCSGGTISYDGGAAFVGNPDLRFRLENSTAETAHLAMNIFEVITGVPMPSPPFDPGCLLHVGLPGIFVFPGVAVVDGEAEQQVPLALGLQGLKGLPLFVQWIEIDLSSSTPLSLSDEGEIMIHTSCSISP